MRVEFAAHHLPHQQSSAAGRQLWAVVEALRAAGHDATVWCWGDVQLDLSAPDWCRRDPHPAPPRSVGGLARTVRSPRGHIAGAWSPPADAIAIADARDSAPALPDDRPAAVVLHHSVALDAAAVGARWTPSLLQERRVERRALGSATSAALSRRTLDAVGAQRLVTPTVPMPAARLRPVDAPVALLLADWSWAPNDRALWQLLALWPDATRNLPAAKLLIAGRGLDQVSVSTAKALASVDNDAVRVVGEVADPSKVMAEAALLVFPCPDSSGPKLKVLDAALHGLPVLTTPAGIEGLRCEGVTVARAVDFGDELASLLADPARRADSAESARAAALAHHAPDIAAATWLDLATAAGSK